jgi:prepilin-type N-terminal cleavage/methylation domain-containing protein
MKNKKNLGFTLIELMIVMAIISILATMGINSYTTAMKRGRDAKRISDVNQIKQALVMYRADSGSYPNALADLEPDYLNKIPTPPRPSTLYTYDGTTTVAGPPSGFRKFSLSIDLEMNSGNSIDATSGTCASTELCKFFVAKND